MIFMNHFHDIVVRPFTEIFSGFYIEAMIKIKASLVLIAIMMFDNLTTLIQISDDLSLVETAIALMYTPKIYWVGLFILSTLDFFFGSVRAAMEPSIKWNWEIFARGAYKLAVLLGLIIMSAVATNMLPLIFGLFQYFIVAILAVKEISSVSRNLGATAVVLAGFQMIFRNSVPTPKEFFDMVYEKDKELIMESQKRKKGLGEQKGDRGEKGEKGEKGEPGWTNHTKV